MQTSSILQVRLLIPSVAIRIYGKIFSITAENLISSKYLGKKSYSYTPIVTMNKNYFSCYSLVDNNNTARVSIAKLSKIVSTIGPTSEQFDVMQNIVSEGMSIMRLNFSHATKEEVELRVKNLNRCQITQERNKSKYKNIFDEIMNVRGILLDTRGPEIRMGQLSNDYTGHEKITLHTGDVVCLHSDSHSVMKGSTKNDIYIDYPSLHTFLKPGSKVLLDDGAVSLTVSYTIESNNELSRGVKCTVDNTGELRSRSGVSFPGIETDLPAMSLKDRDDIKYGMSLDIDYISPSFVKSADDIREIKRYVKKCAEDLKWNPSYPLPLIISKIESLSALRNFRDILKESDGIMVARGDLGVELPIQEVTNAQKEMVTACNVAGKPVIVATQMLESMTKNPRPTRAEVSDVSNAVHDGADALMTSGETAKGKYPIETVKMMNEIIRTTEKYINNHPDLAERERFLTNSTYRNDCSHSIEESIAKAAVIATSNKNVTAILVVELCESKLSILISAYRPRVPIIVFTSSAKIARQLIIYRGIYPVYGTMINFSKKKCLLDSINYTKTIGFVCKGDNIVYVGEDKSENLGNSVTMSIYVVS